MKLTSYFLMALAASVTIVSCKQEADSELDLSNVKKSVTILIANQGTRAAVDAITPVDDEGKGPLVVEQNALYAVFADAAGNIVGASYPLAEVAGDDVDGNKYSFHQLPSSIMQVAVTNLPVTAGITTLTDLLATYDDDIDQGELDESNVPVWDQADLVLTGTDTHEPAVLEYYTAEVSVEALLARIEINNIQCDDLGTAQLAEGGYPRYRSLTLEEISLIYATDPANAAELKDVLNGAVLDDAADIFGAESEDVSGVFAYNVVPTTEVPSIQLKINAATRNLSDGSPAAVPTGMLPLFIKTQSLGEDIDAAGIEAGNIYQINYIFSYENVKGENEDPSLICVDVVVSIQNWEVKTVERPTYE
jgi:hypothetical protein